MANLTDVIFYRKIQTNKLENLKQPKNYFLKLFNGLSYNWLFKAFIPQIHIATLELRLTISLQRDCMERFIMIFNCTLNLRDRKKGDIIRTNNTFSSRLYWGRLKSLKEIFHLTCAPLSLLSFGYGALHGWLGAEQVSVSRLPSKARIKTPCQIALTNKVNNTSQGWHIALNQTTVPMNKSHDNGRITKNGCCLKQVFAGYLTGVPTKLVPRSPTAKRKGKTEWDLGTRLELIPRDRP